MTATKKNVTIGSILGGSVILAAILALSGFETKASHASDVQLLRTEQKESAAQQEAHHQRQYDRILCELEATREKDDRVCR